MGPNFKQVKLYNLVFYEVLLLELYSGTVKRHSVRNFLFYQELDLAIFITRKQEVPGTKLNQDHVEPKMRHFNLLFSTQK